MRPVISGTGFQDPTVLARCKYLDISVIDVT